MKIQVPKVVEGKKEVFEFESYNAMARECGALSGMNKENAISLAEKSGYIVSELVELGSTSRTSLGIIERIIRECEKQTSDEKAKIKELEKKAFELSRTCKSTADFDKILEMNKEIDELKIKKVDEKAVRTQFEKLLSEYVKENPTFKNEPTEPTEPTETTETTEPTEPTEKPKTKKPTKTKNQEKSSK